MKRRWCLLLLGAALSAVPAMTVFAGDMKVDIRDHAYNPPDPTVAAGTKVTWINRDEVPHTATEVTGKFASPALDTDESFSVTLTEPGTYHYYCKLHPKMTATVTVTK